ncbi:BQ5605_C012g06820 [Microbotryum silenes-dioicae]|uniref:BQ5605_C012g06820 protein n=1 Tax=Microbotryum silenes-dioicae TaxID=796604 RepID=A0A2X0NV63_9BASI|nr:BQ5605_C012g06820 [Microbotryum silenes-dioicae]
MPKIFSHLGFPLRLRQATAAPAAGPSLESSTSAAENKLDLDPATEKDGQKGPAESLIETEKRVLRQANAHASAERHVQVDAAFVDVDDLDPEFLDPDGKERVIQTAHDYSTRLISLEDDQTLPVHMRRLTCFGAILGEILTFRPQVYEVSSLFLQIIAYSAGTKLPGFSQAGCWKH